MPTVNSFEDLVIWQNAQQLATVVYSLVDKNPKITRDYSFKDQIKRAVLSVSNNIAEGFEYNNNNHFIRYLRIAKGSCGEVRNCLLFAVAVGFDSYENLQSAILQSKILAQKIGSLINYLTTKRQPATR